MGKKKKTIKKQINKKTNTNISKTVRLKSKKANSFKSPKSIFLVSKKEKENEELNNSNDKKFISAINFLENLFITVEDEEKGVSPNVKIALSLTEFLEKDHYAIVKRLLTAEELKNIYNKEAKLHCAIVSYKTKKIIEYAPYNQNDNLEFIRQINEIEIKNLNLIKIFYSSLSPESLLNKINNLNDWTSFNYDGFYFNSFHFVNEVLGAIDEEKIKIPYGFTAPKIKDINNNPSISENKKPKKIIDKYDIDNPNNNPDYFIICNRCKEKILGDNSYKVVKFYVANSHNNKANEQNISESNSTKNEEEDNEKLREILNYYDIIENNSNQKGTCFICNNFCYFCTLLRRKNVALSLVNFFNK